MIADKMKTGMPGINPNQGSDVSGVGLKRGPQGPGSLGGEDFRRALEQQLGTMGPAGAQALKGPVGAGAAEKLKFSQHSVERMHSRGISFEPEEMQRIEGAVTRAAAKGSKDALILSGDKALIVSVKNNTVVTVMDRAAMKDNVFTNIDSTVVL